MNEGQLNSIYNAIKHDDMYGSQEYTSGSGNWTIPSGVYTCDVLILAAGGGGGGGSSNAGGGGGASGGIMYLQNIIVTPADTIAYSIGAAGSGGGAASAGSAGGNSTFGNATIYGGSGGAGTGGGTGGAGGAAGATPIFTSTGFKMFPEDYLIINEGAAGGKGHDSGTTNGADGGTLSLTNYPYLYARAGEKSPGTGGGGGGGAGYVTKGGDGSAGNASGLAGGGAGGGPTQGGGDGAPGYILIRWHKQ
nr:hypothetical protein 7 [Legionellales bacterium]